MFCANCALQERRFPPLQVFRSELCGFGLKVCAPLEPGTLLAEYTGEVVAARECVRRMAAYGQEDGFYLAELGEGYFLDAKDFGTPLSLSVFPGSVHLLPKCPCLTYRNVLN